MMAKICAFLFALGLSILSNTAFGQTPPQASVDTNANAVVVVAPLRKGTPAPFDGVLYSPAAAAQATVDRNACPAQIKIEVEHATASVQAQCQFKLDLQTASAAAAQKIANAEYSAKDAQLKAAEAALAAEQAAHKHDGWKVFGGVTGGFVAGAIITTAIVFGVNQASHTP